MTRFGALRRCRAVSTFSTPDPAHAVRCELRTRLPSIQLSRCTLSPLSLVSCDALPIVNWIYVPSEGDTRYKVLWIGKIAKHKSIGETKVLCNFSFTEIPVSELKWAN